MKTMTSRQRLLALLRGQPTDRIGNTLRGLRPWDARRCGLLHESYRPLVEAARQHGDWIAPIGLETGFYGSVAPLQRRDSVRPPADGETVEHRVTEVAGPRGTLREVVAFDRVQQLSMTVEHFIKTPEDAETFLALDYAAPRPDVAGVLAMDRRIGERGLVMVGFTDPVGMLHSLVGTETLAFWSFEHRDLLHRLLTELARRTMDFLKHVAGGLRGRATLIYGYTGPEVVVPPLHPPEDFRDLCYRYDRPINDLVHEAGGFVHVHCHGSIGKLLESLADMGTDFLHPVEAPPMGDTPLVEAKRRIGDRVVLEGNVQIADVMEEEPAAFRRRVERTVAEGKPGGRFCLCPTASPYAVELSDRALRNYLTLIEVAETEGRY
jgi:uroporphyrinogen-III decarboxylase